MLKMLPKSLFEGDTGCLRILNEEEWREIGIVQSAGWEHYEIHGTFPLFFLNVTYSCSHTIWPLALRLIG